MEELFKRGEIVHITDHEHCDAEFLALFYGQVVDNNDKLYDSAGNLFPNHVILKCPYSLREEKFIGEMMGEFYLSAGSFDIRETEPDEKSRYIMNVLDHAKNKPEDEGIMRYVIGYIVLGLDDIGEMSDGYHSFNELYDFRLLYNAALFNEWADSDKYHVVKSKRHSDGKECFGGGWFIVTAQLPTGQISNHYRLDAWDLFRCEEVENAPEWDGHTPDDVRDRLERLISNRG